MGTASFSVGQVDAASVGGALSSVLTTSGAFTTTTSAANLEDASGDVTFAAGQVLRIHADEAMRIAFGGATATASTGHYIPADATTEFVVREAGTASIIDVA